MSRVDRKNNQINFECLSFLYHLLASDIKPSYKKKISKKFMVLVKTPKEIFQDIFMEHLNCELQQ